MVTIDSIRTPEDAAAFRDLNTEWIERLFGLEDEDRRTLGDPFAAIVAPGGDVLIARDDAGTIVGCVALILHDGGRCEMSKMTVAPAARGGGIGRLLIAAAIERARALGATSMFLGSSTTLPDAVHLYESTGFVHVPPAELGMPYVRADVFMMKEI